MVIATASAPVWHSSEIASSHVGLLEALEQSLRRGRHPSMCSELTDREWSTLVLLTDATLSQKDVARSLGITLDTLKTHLRSLYQKLGAHSRAEAIELGLLRGRE